MAVTKKINLKQFQLTTAASVEEIQKLYPKKKSSMEYMPWAMDTSYLEIAENIIIDKNGPWASPLYFTISYHSPQHGVRNLCIKANEYIEELKNTMPIDILSISAKMTSDKIELHTLVRSYAGPFNFKGFFEKMGDNLVDIISDEKVYQTGHLIVPDEIKNFSYTKEQLKKHDEDYAKQCEIFKQNSIDKPFLNSIEEYTPEVLPTPADSIDLIYDLLTSDMKCQTLSSYDDFTKIFQEIMTYVSGVEYYHYVTVITGEESEESFMEFLKQYIYQTYVKTERLYEEDVPTMLDKLYRSLFQLYIVQDLIDDPEVTDIKITAPDAIRARIHGDAYITNISFVDRADYLRFINAIAIRNRILQTVPSQTFTDTSDKNYILRFSITAEYVNSVKWPYLHIRKIDRNKLLGDDLMGLTGRVKEPMFDKKIRDYLLECGKKSRGVVFAGPPGSGKTVALNWFLEEAYEQSAEILVIQENDELFCNRKGVMFQHVVNYPNGQEKPVNLEQLGQLALVAGANVFIIGEAKGAEICSAITLSNSGCRTAITIHSPSSTETIDKMADLAMRGYAQDYEQALRMLKSFQTIVYLERFKVQEISEITGFNEETMQMEYNYIYRREK